MSAPQLSIILPNYNHADYLPRCVEAILRQSFTDTELIVVDDGSTDDSVEVLERFARKDARVRFYRNQENKGVAYTLNRALGLARGEFVHGAAADDYVLPGFFETAVRMLRANPQAGLALGLTDCIDDAGRLRHIVPGPWADHPTYISPDDLCTKIGECGVPGPTVWRRELFLQVGAYNPDLKWHCDWFALQVIAFRHGLCFFPQKTTVVRMTETAYSVAGQRDPKTQRPVLQRMLGLMGQAQYGDVLPRFRRSNVLRQFGPELLRAAATMKDISPAAVETVRDLAFAYAPEVLAQPDAEVRAAMAAFLARYGKDTFAFYRQLGGMLRDPDPGVRAAAAATRRVVRRAIPARVAYSQFKWTVAKVMRRLDRFTRPLHHERMDRIESLLHSIMNIEHQNHNALSTINGNLERLAVLAARAAEHPPAPKPAPYRAKAA